MPCGGGGLARGGDSMTNSQRVGSKSFPSVTLGTMPNQLVASTFWSYSSHKTISSLDQQ